jgi:hypothetical protein
MFTGRRAAQRSHERPRDPKRDGQLLGTAEKIAAASEAAALAEPPMLEPSTP